MIQENKIIVTVWAEVFNIDLSTRTSSTEHITKSEVFNIDFFGSLGKTLQRNIIDTMFTELTKNYAIVLDNGVNVNIRKASDISDYELEPRIASALGLHYAF